MKLSKIYFYTLFCLAIGGSFSASAQQVYKISQYLDRSFVHNPAAAGANNVTSVGAIFRTQWSSIDGGPKTAIAFGDTYIPSKNLGAGVVLYTDKTGPTTRTGGEINLSYSIKLDGDEKRLMFGLGGEVVQFKVDLNKLSASIPDDPLLKSSGTSTKGDASAGIYYRSSTFNVGVSVKQLIQSKLKLITDGTTDEGRLYRHYYLITSYNWKTDEDNVLIPHFEMRYLPNAPVDFEAGAVITHKDLLSFGIGFHYKQSYTLYAGLKIAHQLQLGYTYDNYTAPISNFDNGNGGHEVSLRYFFKK